MVAKRSGSAVPFVIFGLAAMLALALGAPPAQSGPAAPGAGAANVELVGQLGGNVTAVAVQGDYAYVGQGPRLVILNVRDRAHPAVVGQTGVLAGVVVGVALGAPGHAYLALGHAGLQVVTVGDKTHPAAAGFLPLKDPYAVAASGATAYVGDGQTLRAVSAADPAHLVETGHLNNSSEPVYGVAVQGSTLFWADGPLLRVAGLANPGHPQELGAVSMSGVTARGMEARGNYVYLAGDDGGVHVINVADPAHPADAGSFATVGSAYDVAVATAGGRIYVYAVWGSGMAILDATSPAAISQAGAYSIAGWSEQLAADAGYAFIADRSSGPLRIVNVSDPAHPADAGAYESSLPGYASNVVAAGNRAYVAAGRRGLRIVDVSSPAQPAPLGSYGMYNARNLALGDPYLYVTDGGMLHIMDVANPAQPVQAGQWQSADIFNDIAVGRTGATTYAYAAVSAGLRVVDVSDPAHPAQKSYFGVPFAYGSGVATAGKYVYLAADGDGLDILDVSDPSHPSLTARWSTTC